MARFLETVAKVGHPPIAARPLGVPNDVTLDSEPPADDRQWIEYVRQEHALAGDRW